MRAWLRRQIEQYVLNPGNARRTVLIIAAVAVWLLAREVVLDTAVGFVGDWIGAAPIWLQIIVVVVIAVATIVAFRLRRARPQPDVAYYRAADELPPVPFQLVGRTEDLAAVIKLFETTDSPGQGGGPVMVAVVGRRGVGTSAIALQAATDVTGRFADGAVHLDLRGLANRPPHTPESALHALMHHIGLPEPRSLQKRDIDDATRRLQAWYAEHSKLLLLNNVDSPQQVLRLLPTSPGCGVVLAGSLDLEALPRVRIHRLDELSEDAAMALLAGVGGRAQVDENRDAARDLVTECGRQPLAIRLLGQLLRDRDWPLTQFVTEMRRSARTSHHFPIGEQPDSLRRVWDAADVTYRDLSSEQRRTFRLLALVPTIEIGRNAAAAVAGLSPERATRALDELTRRGLIESARPGYYRVRQLLAGSAGYHLINEDSQRDRQRARFRLVRYYALLAEQYAEPLLFIHGRNNEAPVSLSQTDGYRWFQHEHDTLQRLIISPIPDDELSSVKLWLWRLAMGLCTWYAIEGRLDAWHAVCQAIRETPPPVGWRARFNGSRRQWPPEIAYWVCNELGVLYRRRGQTNLAYATLENAQAIATQWRLRSRAQVETNLGLVLIDKGQVEQAVVHLGRSLNLRARSDVRGRAISELGLGIASMHAELYDSARKHLSHAANEFERLGDQAGQAAALNALGLVLAVQGDRPGIREHWDLARLHYANIGDKLGEASVLLNIGADMLRDQPDQVHTSRRLLSESLELRRGQPETVYTALLHHRLSQAAALENDDVAAQVHRQEARRILEEPR